MLFDMFVEGDRPMEQGRQYVTLKDFRVPVMVDKHFYLKPIRMVIDVTGHGLSSTASQSEFAEWLEADPNRVQDLVASSLDIMKDVARDPSVQKEAREFMQAMGRTIK